MRIDPSYFRPTEAETLLSEPSQAKAKQGWATVQRMMCAEITATDPQEAQRHALLKANVYKINVSVE